MTNRQSKALGRTDPRPRTPQDKPRVKYPLVERDGELSIEFSAIGGLATDPARGAYLRVHEPLAVLPGSPYALTLKTAPSLKTTKQGLTYVPTNVEAREILTKAAPTPDDVKDSSGDSVTALIQRERDARVAADSALDTRVGVLEAAPAGSVNTLEVTVDFGASFTHFAQTVVTGETWVEGTSKIVAMVTGSSPEEQALMQFSATVSDLVVGDGFTLSVYTPIEAKGTYTFACIGV